MAASSLPGIGIVTSFQKLFDEASLDLPIKPFVVLFLVLNVLFIIMDYRQALQNWYLFSFFSPLWVPLVLGPEAHKSFVEMNKAQSIFKLKTVLLELKMPRDTRKTPLAMETILSSLHIGSGEGNRYAREVKGGTRPWFSLEIVSLGGRVHFYLWTREQYRRGIESLFYAQYPGIEIIEAEDYSRLVDPASEGFAMWGDEFVHTKPDPYPIKTYVDYGLDKAGAKPEEQIDPLTQLIEILGSIGPEEQIWVQMVIRVSKGEKFVGRTMKDGKPMESWKDEAKDLIKELREKTMIGKTETNAGFPSPTKGEGDIMNAIERNIAKQGFDVGMRAIYTAPKEAFQGGKTIAFVVTGMLKPFMSESHNGFKPAANFDAAFNDYPWEDRGGKRKQEAHETVVNLYRRRLFFHNPYVGDWMTMSTEELATMYHVPSATVATPGLPRIQSTTGVAPTNLPT